MADISKLANAMGELDEDEVVAILEKVMAEGGQDAEKAMEACQSGMDLVGNKFESGEYYVSDLIYAGDIMTQAVGILKDALIKGDGAGVKAKMILCTVKADLHDIGKNIVKSMLEAAGFEVVDLGIDVSPETIVEEAKKTGIKIIGLSGVLTLAIDSMKETIDAFEAAGLRDSVKIIVGGAPVNENVCKITGADHWAVSPQVTVQTCKGWAASM